MSAPSPPHLVPPPLPTLPSREKLTVFTVDGILAIGKALLPVGYLIWQDIQDNEFTDWRKIRTIAIIAAGTEAVSFYRKYQAWLSAPPGMELVKVTTATVDVPGVPLTTVVSTEQLAVVPKPEEPK